MYTQILLLMWHMDTAAINSGQIQRGDITMCYVKWETDCISFEEFVAQFIDLGAHVY